MDYQEIRATHAVLHLIYHRNKNQHQRAKWWRWLSQLKRTALDLGSQDASVVMPDSYKQHLAAHLIPKCYLAFSTVIAENQFSTLGIVLLATLSRFSKATGTKYEAETRRRAQVKKTLTAAPAEDFGERVSRSEAGGLPTSDHERQVPRKISGRSTTEKASTSKRTKQASKRKKNAIDDLFSGLL
ncbi:uncharacterized protein N7482_005289 [Penicillium canariense]|uniref:RNase MRP protein 1 RNA binding domain-containing protein n=1 Tax=Penicillium canariense TaxID=189055 RepID=A0A9W9LNA9_9EURO|nr:uncharacterized protein N7482_005289 [Penicillium canariense]KAJ5166508.1 hypothetical protein N7482_005289 [Penicillium canariense]